MFIDQRRTIVHLTLPVLLMVVLLAACGGETAQQTKPAPTPTPTPSAGQQALTTMANKLNNAKTLHGRFNVSVTSQAANGEIVTEIWKENPNKNRFEVRNSTIQQIQSGSITVTDGKTLWQYDPEEKVVYTGPVPPAQNAASTGLGSSSSQNQGQFILNVVQSIFTNSDGTLVSDKAVVDNQPVNQVHVVPQGSTSGNAITSFDYEGDVYIHKTKQLPVKVDLNITGLGKVVLTIPFIETDKLIAADTFTYTPPASITVKPLKDVNNGQPGNLTLAQAKKQAGHPLLSIPGEQSDYTLNSVTALGTPGNQTYSLNYMKGNTAITLTQSKALAGLNTNGKQVKVRNTSGTVSTSNGTTQLAWTENGVGIRLSSKMTETQLIALANILK